MKEKHSNLNGLAYLFIAIIVISLLTSLFLSLLKYYCDFNIPFWLNVFISESTLVIPYMVYFQKKGVHLFRTIQLKRVSCSTVVKVILLTITLSPLYLSANLLSQLFVPNTMLEASPEMMQVPPYMLMFITAIFAPVCEEYIFRGLLVHQYQKSISVMQIVLITGVLFGIMHLNFNQFCYASILGMIFVVVNYASGSILTSFIMHACINGTNSIMMLLVSAVSSGSMEDTVNAVEAVDMKSVIISVIPLFMVLSVLGIVISIPILKSIAKKERNISTLSDIFTKEDMVMTEENKEIEISADKDVNLFTNVATWIAILVGLFGMFGWKPLIYSLGIFG